MRHCAVIVVDDTANSFLAVPHITHNAIGDVVSKVCDLLNSKQVFRTAVNNPLSHGWVAQNFDAQTGPPST